jgi:hypothetical protein
MLDILHIPGQSDNIWIFESAGTTAWQTWTKPRNCKFIWMMCIGGGAGGGLSNGAGAGGVVRALFPANVLSDTLFIQPGPGGAASATGNRSFVSLTPSSATVMNIVCTSGALPAGTGGTPNGETIATIANAGLLSLGNFIAVAGPAGATSPLATSITMGGANGGQNGSPPVNYASINLGTTVVPALNGGNNTTGGKGDNGFWSWKPMYGTGGMGGGYNASGIGGNGGDGAYGCGGGGNGTGTGGSGTGGRGGDGLVIIATF